MGSISVGPMVDETDLDEELAELQQQDLEDKMRETGAVTIDRLPTVANGESKLPTGSGFIPTTLARCADSSLVKGKAPVAAVEEDDEEAELRRLQAEMAV